MRHINMLIKLFIVIYGAVGSISSMQLNQQQLNDLLIRAAIRGDLQGVQKVSDQGAQIEFADNKGYTSLMYAGFRGHVPIIEFLLEKNADANAVDRAGNTALAHAAFGRKNEKTPNIYAIKILYYFMDPKPTPEQIDRFNTSLSVKKWLKDPSYTEQETERLARISIPRRLIKVDKEIEERRREGQQTSLFKKPPVRLCDTEFYE